VDLFHSVAGAIVTILTSREVSWSSKSQPPYFGMLNLFENWPRPTCRTPGRFPFSC
jgi:hypothetical protein